MVHVCSYMFIYVHICSYMFIYVHVDYIRFFAILCHIGHLRIHRAEASVPPCMAFGAKLPQNAAALVGGNVSGFGMTCVTCDDMCLVMFGCDML